jgi:hypothetical protein
LVQLEVEIRQAASWLRVSATDEEKKIGIEERFEEKRKEYYQVKSGYVLG